jgi:hypothetical protein
MVIVPTYKIELPQPKIVIAVDPGKRLGRS